MMCDFTIKIYLKFLESLEEAGYESETSLPDSQYKYKLIIAPDLFHSVLSYEALYVGEGSTITSECTILDTLSIYVNSLSVGYSREQETKYQLCHHFKKESGVIEKANEILHDENYRQNLLRRRDRMLGEMTDVTSLMVWFVEGYPNSFRIMKENPEYQFNFLP